MYYVDFSGKGERKARKSSKASEEEKGKNEDVKVSPEHVLQISIVINVLKVFQRLNLFISSVWPRLYIRFFSSLLQTPPLRDPFFTCLLQNVSCLNANLVKAQSICTKLNISWVPQFDNVYVMYNCLLV